MGRYFLEVSYKGTAYSGFQIQENAVTIQSKIEEALRLLHREHIALTGSSRTDAGVHANQNFFHFDFDKNLHPQAVYKLNAILPIDIAVKNIHPVSEKAHSRFDAICRRYEYSIHTSKNPFLRDTSYYYPYKLDIDRLVEGSVMIKENKNFKAFAKSNSQAKTDECSIYKSKWVIGEDTLHYEIEANRFLRGMVRLITGMLLAYGRNKVSKDELIETLNNDRKAIISTPSYGLMLKEVLYPKHYFLNDLLGVQNFKN